MPSSLKLFPLYAENDREAVKPVLDALKLKNVTVTGGENPAPGSTVLLFLSENFSADEELQIKYFAAEGSALSVIPVNLDGSEPPELVKSALYARHTISAKDRSPEELAELIAASSEQTKPKSRLPIILGIVIAAVVIIVLALTLGKKGDGDKPDEPAVSSSSEEEAEPEVYFGMTKEDLAKIEDVIIIGEKYAFIGPSEMRNAGQWPDTNYLGYRNWEDNHAVWYSTEDGSAIPSARYDDLGFLSYMPNLRFLYLCNAELGSIPNLSDAEKLQDVYLQDCTVFDLAWLEGAGMTSFNASACGIEDFSYLGSCEWLKFVHIDFTGTARADFTDFSPTHLDRLELENGFELADIDLSSLASCKSISLLRFRDIPLSDISWLSGNPSIQHLELENLQRLPDISAVETLTTLKGLHISNCPQIADYTPVSGCTRLNEFSLHTEWNQETDLMFLSGLNRLSNISVSGLSMDSLDFLEELSGNGRMSLSLHADIRDYAGLADVDGYERLEIGPDNGDASAFLPYLVDKYVNELVLDRCYGLDLSVLPDVRTRLEIKNCDLRDLSGMPALNILELALVNNPYLTSLSGIEAFATLGKDYIGKLDILNCPRLTDFSALDGAVFKELWFRYQFILPDFGKMSFNNLYFEGIDGMTDLHFLENIEDRKYDTFSFAGQDEITDLSPLRKLSIQTLKIPPQLEAQAKELKNDGVIGKYEIVFPEAGWFYDESELSLLSLEELDTLPAALLSRVARVKIIGNRVLDWHRYNLEKRWYDDSDHIVLRDHQRDYEEEFTETGSITDFEKLLRLSSLRELELDCQPITDLSGIQDFSSLEVLTLQYDSQLTDISPAFTLQSIRSLMLRGIPVDSLEGIQNLKKLNFLNLDSMQITDLSALESCDFSNAEEYGGFQLEMYSMNDCRDFDFLENIHSFRYLAICDNDAANWLDKVKDAYIPYLTAHNSKMTNEDVAGIAANHPELIELQMSWNREVTDLTPLLQLENLTFLRISHDMEEAIRSLDGAEYTFRLEIEGE